jgi:glycosyltransferase involved in cell wall biosynthesis
MFIGTGPDLEMLQRYVIDNDMQGQVLFLGLRDDMPTVLSFVDLLVSTSISSHEGMSNVILEAMASGKPVISTESVGSAEIIRDGYNGFLVDSASTQHLCESILLLQKNRPCLRNWELMQGTCPGQLLSCKDDRGYGWSMRKRSWARSI